MAGDWLKMELCLPDKPEVLAMSALTGMEPDLIVGKCFRVWRWFDQHTEEGNAAGVTLVTLGYAIGNGPSSTTFLDAMKSVGWVEETQEGVRLPNFDRHNGETAKKRALTAKRVAKHKATANAKGNAEANAESNAVSVSGALPREEKRREEKKEQKHKEADASGVFDEAWNAYPKREGGNSKTDALKAWNARVKAGVPESDMLAGIKRYAAYCTATGIVGQRFVKQASSFLGTGEHWRQDWGVAGAPVREAPRQLPGGGISGESIGLRRID